MFRQNSDVGLVLLLIVPFAYCFYVFERGTPCYADEHTNNSCGLGIHTATGAADGSDGFESIYDGQLIMINYYLRHYFPSLIDGTNILVSGTVSGSLSLDLDPVDPIIGMDSLEEPYTDINPPIFGAGMRLFSVVPNALYGLWFSLVSVTSIGYGDIYPTTYLGQGITVIILLLGTIYTAIPLSILIDTYIVAISSASDREEYADKPHNMHDPNPNPNPSPASNNNNNNNNSTSSSSSIGTRCSESKSDNDTNPSAATPDELYIRNYIYNQHKKHNTHNNTHNTTSNTNNTNNTTAASATSGNIRQMRVLRTIYINLHHDMCQLATRAVAAETQTNVKQSHSMFMYNGDTGSGTGTGTGNNNRHDDIEVCIPGLGDEVYEDGDGGLELEDELGLDSQTHHEINTNTTSNNHATNIINNNNIKDMTVLLSHVNIATLLHHILSLNRCKLKFRQLDEENCL